MKKKIPVSILDSTVPVPEDVYTYPFKFMEVGDSFTVDMERMESVRSLATRYSKESGTKFTTRKIDQDTVRVWRVE